jgi:hypothetical protein
MNQFTLKNGTAAITLDLTPGMTVGEVLGNPNFAAVLGYDSAAVEIYSAGCKLESTSQVVADDVLVVSPKAHSKASDATFTLKNGTAAITLALTPGLTVGEVRGNVNFAAVLGYDSTAVELYSAGCKLDDASQVVADDVLVVSPKAHSKATL